MRKLLLAAAGLACLASVSYRIATADNPSAPADLTHKIGLIDMGYVFNEYDKHKMLREEWLVEAQEAEAKIKQMAASLQSTQQQLKQLKSDSPEFADKEKKLAELSTKYSTEQTMMNRDLQKKQAKMVHTVYQEVQDAVGRLARHNGYTLVLRFSREELSTSDPKKLAESLNQQVVYHRNGDDMTDYVLDMLQKKYEKSKPVAGAPAAKKNAVKPVAGTAQGKKGGAAAE